MTTTAPTPQDIADAPLSKDARIWERRFKALAMRHIETKTFAQIAAELGVSEDTAANDVRRAIQEVVRVPAEQMVDRQRAILLELVRTDWPGAKNGDLEKQAMILRFLQHESQLFGLNAPTRVAVGISAHEFGRCVAELLPLVGAAPLYELAGLPTTGPSAQDVIDGEITEPGLPDGEPWSNLGVP
jgi:Sigma-70, region 4